MTGANTDQSQHPIYSTSTAPWRYRYLHPGARQLLDDLEQKYLVTRTSREGAVSGQPRPDEGVIDVVDLRPERRDQGALSVTFTRFPGLDVRFGRWHREVCPWSESDDCDDDPALLLADLTAMVSDLVAGNFVEHLRTGPFHSTLSYRTPTRSGRNMLTRTQGRDKGRAARHAWAAWTPRVPIE